MKQKWLPRIKNAVQQAYRRTPPFLLLILFISIPVLTDITRWIVSDQTFFLATCVEWYRKLQSGNKHNIKTTGEAIQHIMVFVWGIVTLLLFIWRILNYTRHIKIQQKQTENQTQTLTMQDQVRHDEQFRQGVEFLSDREAGFVKKHAGVSILGSLAQRSSEHRQFCVDILCGLNEWVAERLRAEPDYFRRKARVGENGFTIWCDRVFSTTDRVFLQDYYSKWLSPGEPMAFTDDQRREAIAAIEQEKLSQLVIKELSQLLRNFIKNNKLLAEDKKEILELRRCYLPQLNIQGLTAGSSIIWGNAVLNGADFSSVQLGGVDLSEAQLQNADLHKAQLQGANLHKAQLQGIDLHEAQLQGTYLHKAQLQGTYLHKAQLQDADLSSAQLQGADLSSAQLQGVNLRSAQLKGVNLHSAQLQGAILIEAQLQGAILTEAQLQGADLSSAQLQGVNFSEAKLQGVNLSEAKLQGALLFNAHLSGIITSTSDIFTGTYCFACNTTVLPDWELIKKQIINKDSKSHIKNIAARIANNKNEPIPTMPNNATIWSQSVVDIMEQCPDIKEKVKAMVHYISTSSELPQDLRDAATQALQQIKKR